MTAAKIPCFHCGEAIRGTAFQSLLQGSEQSFCCMGCQAAATTIDACGLGHFYQYRDQPSDPVIDRSTNDQTAFDGYNNPQVQAQFVSQKSDGQISFYLQISGITCAACVWLIEQRLKQLPGVSQAALNLSTHRLLVTLEASRTPVSDIFTALGALGYSAKPWQRTEKSTHFEQTQKDFIIRLGIAGIGLMQIMMNTTATYIGDIAWEYVHLLRWASLIFTLPVVLYAALPFYRAAIRDLKTGHFGMDVPVSLALILAFIPSAWATLSQTGETYFESVTMFTFFLLLGRFLEFRALLKLDHTGHGLDDLLPPFTQRWDKGEWQRVSSSELAVGDRILILPGEKIPADGTVLSGESEINAATFTGEFAPLSVAPGDAIQAGTLNTDGALEVSVTHSGQQSSMSHMLTLLDQAASYKPAIARLADTGASYFVIFILLLAAATGLIWLSIDATRAFWIALSVLVITCPCALSLATPVSVTASISALRQSGILPTQGEAFLQLKHIDTVIFDKTGTLTDGQYSLVETLSDHTETHLQVAAALEHYSSHPIAKAFTNADPSIVATEVMVHPNAGIEGTVMGNKYRIGTPAFCCVSDPTTPLSSTHDDVQWIALSVVGKQDVIAWFAIQDCLRVDAKIAVDTLRSRGLSLHLLTGDPSTQGNKIAAQLNIAHCHSGKTATEKMHYIKALQAEGHRVAMVGDGVNDAPAMACADVAIALSQGAELTQNSADIILMTPKLAPLATLMAHSYRTHRVIKQNLAWGLLYNGIALPFAVAGYVSPLIAAIGMSFSSLLVVVNALGLNRRLT